MLVVWLLVAGLFSLMLLALAHVTYTTNPLARARRDLRQAFRHVDRVFAETKRQMNQAGKRNYGNWQEWL